jgi:ABC-type nitrate/sulfonate/bicarbonate transport system substrate-binding protein
MADSLGLFAAHNLRVELHRELGWGTIRDKIVYGELEAAAAPAGLLVALNCGLQDVQADCLTGLVLNLHGNAITLSQRLWNQGMHNGASLRHALLSREEPLTLGVVHRFSSHSFLLRIWLRSLGLDPDRAARLVVMPPSQGPANLQAGHLDGYCVGEPWNSAAVLAKTGWIAASSAQLAPRHPEKVLLVRRGFAETHESKHLALIAALSEACVYCDDDANRAHVIETLARPEYVGVPPATLRNSLGGPLDLGNGQFGEQPDFHVFARDNANEPSFERAMWTLRSVRAIGAGAGREIPEERAQEWFRPDLFQQATQLTSSTIAS